MGERLHIFLFKFVMIVSISVSLFIGISSANNLDSEVMTYYVMLEPDMEGNAYFQINIQNFDYNKSKIFGIATLKPNVKNCTLRDGNKSYEYHVDPRNTSINIIYNDGKIETVGYFVGSSAELDFFGHSYCGVPVPAYKQFILTTYNIKKKNISNFDIKFYDSNFNSEVHYNRYPFDWYKFTYNIIFLNETFVYLTVSPANPDNFYEVGVSLNHTYKNKTGFDSEEEISPVYNGIYKTNFETNRNESIDSINIIYTRKTGLAKISFYILCILLVFYMLCIIFSNKMHRELNAMLFGTFLTIHTFSSSVGLANKPIWLDTLSYFEMLFYIDSFLIIVYFAIIVKKLRE